jgi:hypothetical protein
VYGADWLDREWANLCCAKQFCATWLIVYGPLNVSEEQSASILSEGFPEDGGEFHLPDYTVSQPRISKFESWTPWKRWNPYPYNYHGLEPNRFLQALSLLTCIWEFLGSDLGWAINYPDWSLSWFSQSIQCFKLGQDLFLLRHFLVSIHPIIRCHIIWATESVAQSVYRRAGGPGFDSRQCKIFLFSTASRPTLGPTQPPIQWVTWAIPSWG